MWPHSFAGILNAKVGDARVRRKIALEGYRFTPQEAVEAGFVDFVVKGDTVAVLDKAKEVAAGVEGNATGGVWGLIKVRVFHSCVLAYMFCVLIDGHLFRMICMRMR